MFIIEKGTTPNGMDIQIENWAETYPNLHKENDTIGFYPMAVNDIYNAEHPYFPAYPKRGQTFRAELKFDTAEEAKEAFEALKSGEKTFIHYLGNYDNRVVSKDNFIKAVTQ